jgi:hypothetical protein
MVRGADGRTWTLRSRMEWIRPATIDDFEHDVASGYGAGVAMFAALCVLIVALALWTPPGVYVPYWLILALLALVAFFPIRWALRRPWMLIANTPGNHQDLTAERWTGTVRGFVNIRQVTAKVARDIEVYSMPNIDGPLHPVD